MEKSRINTKKILKEMFNIEWNNLSKTAQTGLDDVENNHNFSWTRDLFEKNKNNLNYVALFYRGSKINYRKLFNKVKDYTAIFEQMGIDENSEVPMCMSNVPEFLYVIMALNLLGAKMNCFGSDFDSEYITEIINDCNSDFIVCTDDKFGQIHQSIENSKIRTAIMFSLTDSLKNGFDPYIELDKPFCDFENKVLLHRQSNIKIIDKFDFEFQLPIERKNITEYNIGNINTEFLVTYSSGSTNSNRPKAIVHSNRSLITIGRFQDPDLSGLPKMKDLTGLALIPSHSNTGIISSISDVLYKGCTVALEPIYKKEFFLYSLAINKPNYVSAPRNMVVYAAKQLYADPKFYGFKMPYMMMLTSVGEPTSLGEEKFINKMLRKVSCGVGKLPRPISPVPLSIGGGDCERGGMFFTPYRAFQDLHPKFKLTGSRCGLKKYAMVELATLDNQGYEVPVGEVGRLVARTPAAMKRYKNNPQATSEFYIKDAYGKIWTDCNVYATIDKYGTLEILERIGKELVLSDGSTLPLFSIGKEVEKDTKHILSYEVVNIDNKLVVHIELQPGVKNNIPKILMGIETRIAKKFENTKLANVLDSVVYRIRSFDEGFVGTGCEKRSYNALVKEGISDKCIKPIIENDEIKIISASEHFDGKAKVKTIKNY